MDKAITASLALTLAQYLRPNPEKHLPFYIALGMDLDELEAAVDAFVDEYDGSRLQLRKVSCRGQIGAGACPGDTFASWGIAIQAAGVAAGHLSRMLRLGTPAVVGYIREDEVLIDLRTVTPSQCSTLVQALEALDDKLVAESIKGLK